jgi:4-hydroxybenzoate polyprenyltransferase
LTRNLLQSIAFVYHARGSTIVGAGPAYSLSARSSLWFSMIGAIIFTTIQTQDLEDMEGDSKRNRRTLPLVYGESIGRISVAVPVALWSIVCPMFWEVNFPSYAPSCIIGFLISFRVLVWRGLDSDRITWQLWCLWIITIYLLPLLKDHSVFYR